MNESHPSLRDNNIQEIKDTARTMYLFQSGGDVACMLMNAIKRLERLGPEEEADRRHRSARREWVDKGKEKRTKLTLSEEKDVIRNKRYNTSTDKKTGG
uniref:XRN2-binding (XTBD) domain-containing protein n=1 Tax=Heterorhabditis bacteriophora TaxID=37862 RepID=A0A1I7WZL2_HETBA